MLCDLEQASVDDVAAAIDGSDAVVFATGAGPGSGAERKVTMDSDGAIKLLWAATVSGVERYVMVSGAGVDSAVRQGPPRLPKGWAPGAERHVWDTVNAVDLPEQLVADAGEWRRWLSAHHADSHGVWLILAKKGTTDPTTLSYDEALDEAICFGWIDGQIGRRDAATFRRRFTPRKARSPWSQRNAAIAERLLSSGRMHQSGEDEVRQAKVDGRWEAAYAGQASMEVPEDLATALSANPRATAMFQGLTSADRYSILYRIGSAKKPETRSRRIAQFVEMLARGQTVHPQAPRSTE
jgi:uncharacterized protein YdeI (YjbR/CyaY-like superfamily)